MVKAVPFRALRPAASKAADVAALPYDVYDRQEAVREVAGKPFSFLNIDRPETQFDDSVAINDRKCYDKAACMLADWEQQGILLQDPADCYYLYELTMDGHSQTGIVACVSIDDYLGGIVKKHENTRVDKEQERVDHIAACHAQTGPAFLAYRESAALAQVKDKVKAGTPVFDFTSEDGIRHRGWVVSDPADISKVQKAFEDLPALYIADGHHRTAAAVRVGVQERQEKAADNLPSSVFLSVIFQEDELRIFDYNRVLKLPAGKSEADILEAVKRLFDVQESADQVKPSRKGEFGMYLGGKWYRLNAHVDILSDDPVDGLDASVLQNHVLQPVFGIDDPRTDPNVDFVGGIRGIGELERRCHADMQAAFSLYPTSMQELLAVADAGRLMPPKSTWFEPKLRSGLFIHKI